MIDQKKPKRVFIGIKASEHIRNECVKLQADLSDLPARFIPPEDIHLTLLPPWEMRQEQWEVEDTKGEALHRIQRLTLTFDSLSYGPNPMRPRLAWIECAPSEELIKLKKQLLQAFSVIDHVPFTPHMTIARFREADQDMLAHRPIGKPLALSMQVDSIKFFRSPHRGGSGYRELVSLPLSQDGIPH